MAALTMILIAFVLVALLGAMAATFGADSRDGADDTAPDPTLTVAGGAH